MTHFHDTKPEIDGISYDDCHAIGLTLDQVNFLAQRGVVWLTAFEAEEIPFVGMIIAPSQEQADLIAFGRGLGEAVVEPMSMICD